MALWKWLEDAGAPQEVCLKASDAVQHFVWATDCRRQANAPYEKRGDGYRPGWGPKADKAHYHGKKCYAEAKKWQDEYTTRAAQARNERTS